MLSLFFIKYSKHISFEGNYIPKMSVVGNLPETFKDISIKLNVVSIAYDFQMKFFFQLICRLCLFQNARNTSKSSITIKSSLLCKTSGSNTLQTSGYLIYSFTMKWTFVWFLCFWKIDWTVIKENKWFTKSIFRLAADLWNYLA